MRSLTETPEQLKFNIIEYINDPKNDYNHVLNGNFVGLYCLQSWFEVDNEKKLKTFELSRLRTQFLIKIKKILIRLEFPNFIIINSLYFLDLVKDYSNNNDDYPEFYKSSEDNLFLNFIVCLMISNKSSNDFAMKSKYWSRLTKIPIKKINELEMIILNSTLKHNPLILNFNIKKLYNFNENLIAKILPFNKYIEDFNKKFNETYNSNTTTVTTSPTPSYSSSSSKYSSSPSLSPASSSSSSSYSPIYETKEIQVSSLNNDSITSLYEYIQTTSSTNFKQLSLNNQPKKYYNVDSVPKYMTYEDINAEQSKYRDQSYELEVYN